MAVTEADKGPQTPFAGVNRRRWSRYRLDQDLPGVLVTEAGEVACVIENVSLAGAKLRLPAERRPTLRRGAALRLAPAAGPSLDGKVAWSGPEALGLAFAYSGASVALTLACLRPPQEG